MTIRKGSKTCVPKCVHLGFFKDINVSGFVMTAKGGRVSVGRAPPSSKILRAKILRCKPLHTWYNSEYGRSRKERYVIGICGSWSGHGTRDSSGS